MKTKLHELLEFPCSFTYKVMGDADPKLVEDVMKVVCHHIPGTETPTIKESSKGNYHSVSVTIHAENIDQIETLYKELGELPCVKMVL